MKTCADCRNFLWRRVSGRNQCDLNIDLPAATYFGRDCDYWREYVDPDQQREDRMDRERDA